MFVAKCRKCCVISCLKTLLYIFSTTLSTSEIKVSENSKISYVSKLLSVFCSSTSLVNSRRLRDIPFSNYLYTNKIKTNKIMERLLFIVIAFAIAFGIGCLGSKRKIGFGLAFGLSLLNAIIGLIAVLCSKKLDKTEKETKKRKEMES